MIVSDFRISNLPLFLKCLTQLEVTLSITNSVALFSEAGFALKNASSS